MFLWVCCSDREQSLKSIEQPTERSAILCHVVGAMVLSRQRHVQIGWQNMRKGKRDFTGCSLVEQWSQKTCKCYLND